MIETWKEVYRYREFLKNSVLKDLRVRYKGSFIGFLWTFLNPLLMLVVYSVLFSIIVKMPVDNYSIFLFCTLLAWVFFNTTVLNSSSIIISSGNLVKKVYFPLEILPISVVLGGLINFLLSSMILFPALIIFGYPPNVNYIWLPLILLTQVVFTLGLAFLVSALTVYFRDLEHMLGIFLTALMYLTPVLYPISMVPEKYRWLFEWNPMGILITAYRDVFYYNQIPDYCSVLILLAVSVGLLLCSQKVFAKLKYSFSEEI